MTSEPAPARAGGESSLSIWLAAARPRTLTASIAPVIVGLALAWHDGRLNVAVGAATMITALLIQIATNLANDYYDFVRGADTAERLGPVRVTQAGLVEPSKVRNAAFTVLGLAAAFGAYLTYVGGLPILVIGAISLVAAIAYTAGPWPLAYRGLGDLFVFVFFGLITVNGTLYLQTGKVTTLSMLSSIPVACTVTAILVVNNLRDIATDAAAGKRTLAVRLGRTLTEMEYFALLAIAFAALPFLMRLAGTQLVIAFGALPMAINEAWALHRRTGAALNLSLGGTAKLHMVYGLLLAAGLIL